MAHNLNVENGKVSMFYHKETPWHGLGKKVDKLATAAEAIKWANMDFTVVKAPIVASYNGKSLAVDEKFATVRTDSEKVLGTVGARYEIIQNVDAFSFFDVLVGEGEAMYETAGVLGRGEVIWILAKLPGYIKVNKQDIVDKYLLLMNSHNGTSSLRAKLTPVRVVCENTLNAALGGRRKQSDEVRIHHTASAHDRLEQAHKLLGLSNAIYNDLGEIFNRMSLVNITGQQVVDYVKTLVPDSEDAVRNTRTVNIREKILSLHESGLGSDMARGTVWGAYNAVTEYVDHVWGKNQTKDKKLQSMWLGSGANMKEEAFRLALELAEIKK